MFKYKKINCIDENYIHLKGKYFQVSKEKSEINLPQQFFYILTLKKIFIF